MPAKAKTRHSCARCNRRVREGEYIYSRFTKSRYCIDLDGCAKRSAKRKS